MATVTGFEGLRHPRRPDLHQFAELFVPLFASSSDDARRQAAAALSQCVHVPRAVCLQIGCAPIAIAAIFLTRSVAFDDDMLVTIIRTQSPAHATAIAKRENLSVKIVDALVERRQTSASPARPAIAATPVATTSSVSQTETDEAAVARMKREEQLRNEIKALAQTGRSAPRDDVRIAPLDTVCEALLVRFARSAEINLFASTLSHALAASAQLGERILLDVSGQQLAMGLLALDMNHTDSLYILQALYPHLREPAGGASRGDALLASLDRTASREKLVAWISADRDARREPSDNENMTRGPSGRHEPVSAPERGPDPRAVSARSGAAMPAIAKIRRAKSHRA